MRFKYTVEDYNLSKLYLKRMNIEYDEDDSILDVIALANLVWKTNEDDS